MSENDILGWGQHTLAGLVGKTLLRMGHWSKTEVTEGVSLAGSGEVGGRLGGGGLRRAKTERLE